MSISLDRQNTKYWWQNTKIADFFLSPQTVVKLFKKTTNNHFICIEKSKKIREKKKDLVFSH